jgi:hypothetical protein
MTNRNTVWVLGALCTLVGALGCSSAGGPFDTDPDADADQPLDQAAPDAGTGEEPEAAAPREASVADAPLVDASVDGAPSVDASQDDASLFDARVSDVGPLADVSLDAADASLADARALADAGAEDAGVDAARFDATGPSEDGSAQDGSVLNGGEAGACSPGASRCTSIGSEYCDATGGWRGSVGACSSACVATAGRYLVSSDGTTVTDTVTALVWQRAQDPSVQTWSAAATSCASQALAGQPGRLPTADELEGLVLGAVATGGHCLPAIDQAAFPGASAASTWTSTWTSDAGLGAVQVVDFSLGNVVTVPPGGMVDTRCVRAP